MMRYGRRSLEKRPNASTLPLPPTALDWSYASDYNSHIIVVFLEVSMKTAPVSQLKARLSEYLDQVKAGAEVLITDRGKTVARLVPVAGNETMKTSLAKMEREGLIRSGTGKLPPDFFDMPQPSDTRSLLREGLLEERSAGDR
jgi:prevent-host-death family protein